MQISHERVDIAPFGCSPVVIDQPKSPCFSRSDTSSQKAVSCPPSSVIKAVCIDSADSLSPNLWISRHHLELCTGFRVLSTGTAPVGPNRTSSSPGGNTSDEIPSLYVTTGYIACMGGRPCTPWFAAVACSSHTEMVAFPFYPGPVPHGHMARPMEPGRQTPASLAHC